jgi:hypothetical protein
MPRNRTVCVLAGLTVLTAATLVATAKIAIVPMPERMAAAELIVVGKVTEIEPRTLSARPDPQAEKKWEYKIAVVEITDGILGAKGMKKVRIGFIPRRPEIAIGHYPEIDFSVGQEGLYILNKHSDADFYEPGVYYNVVDKKSANFEHDVEYAKRCARLLADPDPGLKAKEAEDRLLTAGLLITRYRGGRFAAAGAKTKAEPIDAAQSKLILEALAAADWYQPRAAERGSPQRYFIGLGLTDKDGWKQPENGQDFAAAAQQWCKDNAASYRIQRLVPEKTEK